MIENPGRVFQMQKFYQLAKVDEITHRVSGVATNSKPDKEDERANYPATKKAYKAWSSEAKKATSASGQDISLGNIRIQHGDTVGGKVTDILFDDDNESIYIETEPISDELFDQIKKGHYTGFSQGGDYAWRICQECGDPVPKSKGNFCANCKKVVGIEYGPIIAEVSYVDNPCHGDAHFDLVKSDGSHQMVKFQKRSASMEPDATPAVSAELPDHTELVKSAVKEALAKTPASELRERITKSATAKSKVKKEQNAKALIDAFVKQEIAKHLPDHLQKDLYTVSRFAGLINELAYVLYSTAYEAEMEQDSSELPGELQEDLENLVETFLAMAEEEANELTAMTAERVGKVMKVTPTGLEKAYSKAAGIIGKMKKAVDDHHAATTDANEEHAATMKGHCDDLKECMGGKAAKVAKATSHQETKSDIDDQEEGEIEPIDPEDEGTENIAQKSYTAADMEKAVNKAVQMVIKQLAKKDDEDEEEEKPSKSKKAAKDDEDDEEEKPAKKSAGIGDRSQRTTQTPVIKAGPVVVADDNRMVRKSGTTVDKETVRKAIQDGDQESQIALMKSATPHNEVPATLVGAVSALGRSRR